MPAFATQIDYKGCYHDKGDRDLTGHAVTKDRMSRDICLGICQDKKFKYAAVQNGNSCFCGNSFGKHGKAKFPTACTTPCAGQLGNDQKCGGPWQNAVYELHYATDAQKNAAHAAMKKQRELQQKMQQQQRERVMKLQAQRQANMAKAAAEKKANANKPTPKKIEKPGQVIGCYKDADKRDLSGHQVGDPKMNGQKCMDICQSKGFKYAGTQYGTQCFCGNSYGSLGEAKNCNMNCAGNAAEKCGGTWANTVYLVPTKAQSAAMKKAVADAEKKKQEDMKKAHAHHQKMQRMQADRQRKMMEHVRKAQEKARKGN